jgi:hypothetical protein
MVRAAACGSIHQHFRWTDRVAPGGLTMENDK